MSRNPLICVVIALCVFSGVETLAGECPFTVLEGYKNTMNFRVWAPEKEDAELIGRELDAYYKRLLKDLKYGGMLKKKPEVYVFKNYKEYLDKTGSLNYNVTHTGGIAIPRSARKPAKVYSFLSDNLISEVLPHELTHLIFREITAGLNTDAEIPLWLDEGMAVYEEKGERYKSLVASAFQNGGLIPLARLVSYEHYPGDLSERALFYAQSASLVDYLLSKYGGSRFLAFSKKMIRGGKSADEALFSTYYPDIRNVSQLSEAWLGNLK